METWQNYPNILLFGDWFLLESIFLSCFAKCGKSRLRNIFPQKVSRAVVRCRKIKLLNKFHGSSSVFLGVNISPHFAIVSFKHSYIMGRSDFHENVFKKLIVTTMSWRNIIVAAAWKNSFITGSSDALQYNSKCHYRTRLMMVFRRQKPFVTVLQSCFWFNCISRPKQHFPIQS